MGSDEGGLEELVELRLSRASRSATRWSSSAIRHRSDSKTAMRAACASGGTVFQSDSEIGSVALIHSDYVLTAQKVRSVSAYDPINDPIGMLGQFPDGFILIFGDLSSQLREPSERFGPPRDTVHHPLGILERIPAQYSRECHAALASHSSSRRPSLRQPEGTTPLFYGFHLPLIGILQARLDRLPYIELVDEILPGGGFRESVDDPPCLSLDRRNGGLHLLSLRAGLEPACA